MPEPTWEWGAVGSPWTLTMNGTSAPTSVTWHEVSSMATTATYNVTLSMADVALNPRMIEYDRIQDYVQRGWASPPVRPVQLTDEELAERRALIAQAEVERQERLERRREREREHAERQERERLASIRAEELLLSFLDETQRAQYERDESFDVIGSRGGHYRINHGVSGNVHLLHEGRTALSLCAHPETTVYDAAGTYLGELPVPDVMLAQMLALQTDELRFNDTANIHYRAQDIDAAAVRAHLAPPREAAAIAS